MGEAIRGTVLSETDKAFGTANTAENTKNEQIAQRGMSDVKAFDNNVGQNHGVGGSGSTASATATANTVPATSAGAHSVAPGSIGSTGSTVGHGTAGVQEQPGVNQRF